MEKQEKILRKLNREITNMYNDGTLETDQFNELTDLTNKALTFCKVGVTLPTKEEMNIEVSQQLIDWGYNEHSSKKIFERGFKSSFYWFRNKIKDNGN
jgi:hypothetical protein